MKITIEINTDNAAFDGCEGGEVAILLHAVAGAFKAIGDISDLDEKSLYDTNGNTCGHITIKES